MRRQERGEIVNTEKVDGVLKETEKCQLTEANAEEMVTKTS